MITPSGKIISSPRPKKTENEKALIWFDKVMLLLDKLMTGGIGGITDRFSRTDKKHIETIREALKK